ncbi:hypothetical protein ADUPG1_011940 [Aduncisulcus paluster]|uniref:Protein LTV1 homolog n=1 Tax=Aduncisulcus paluster TaxID=2918883 RepID=A0ABQ5JXR1_9EUKA|nr:hypothetical protein ADUPG1_011940 [Aduncisulcus paluster]
MPVRKTKKYIKFNVSLDDGVDDEVDIMAPYIEYLKKRGELPEDMKDEEYEEEFDDYYGYDDQGYTAAETRFIDQFVDSIDKGKAPAFFDDDEEQEFLQDQLISAKSRKDDITGGNVMDDSHFVIEKDMRETIIQIAKEQREKDAEKDEEDSEREIRELYFAKPKIQTTILDRMEEDEELQDAKADEGKTPQVIDENEVFMSAKKRKEAIAASVREIEVGRQGIPLGVIKRRDQAKIKGEEGDLHEEEEYEEEEEEKPVFVRKKQESKEEKKMRKKAVKEAKKKRREEKKERKQMFHTEYIHQKEAARVEKQNVQGRKL